MSKETEDYKLTLTPTECAQLLGLGKDKIYELCHSNQLPAVKVGNRFLIIRSQLDNWLINNSGQSL